MEDKPMIKNNISILCSGLVALALVGCSQMPVNQAAPLINTLHAGIIQEPIIAYFSEDAGLLAEEGCIISGYSSTPVKGGFYRKLLGRNSLGYFLTQDFYQDSDKPQSSPFWVKDVEGLNSFDSTYVEGPITGYYQNGKMSFESHYQDGEPIGTQKFYYNNGQLAYTDIIKDSVIYAKYWYENGRPAAEIHFSVDDEEFNPKGQIWDQQGQAITDQTQRIQTLYDLEKQVNSQK